MKNAWTIIKNTFISLGKWIAHRWPLKLLSLFFAIILWNFVLGQTNPLRIVRVSDISIQVINQSTLYSNDLTLTEPIESSLPKVWVTLEVPLQEVSRAQEMVVVTADLRGITQEGTATIPLTVTTTSSGRVVSQSISSIQVQVEKRVSRTFTVSCTELGSMPDGYYINKTTIEPSSITVTGPASVVQSIQKVQVPVTVQGLTADYQVVQELEFLDAAGESIDTSMISTSNSDAIVSLEIYRSKELPILLDKAVIGEDALADGYEILLMETVPDAITVIGKPEVVDAMTGVDIELVDVKDASADVKVTRSIKLPTGAYCRETSTVEVVIRVQEKTTSVTLQDVPIRYTSLPEGMELAASPQLTATVEVRGPESTLARLTVADVESAADLSQCIAGRNTIPLKLTIPDEFRATEQMVNPLTVDVTVQVIPRSEGVPETE